MFLDEYLISPTLFIHFDFTPRQVSIHCLRDSTQKDSKLYFSIHKRTVKMINSNDVDVTLEIESQNSLNNP